MTPDGLIKLKNHEGLRLKPYKDTVGKITIGYGHNLTDVGITYDEAKMLFDGDVQHATASARQAFPWFDTLDPVRQDVIVNLVFNMGIDGLKEFKRTLAAIERGDWTEATAHLLDSLWATQVQESRRDDITRALKTGNWWI